MTKPEKQFLAAAIPIILAFVTMLVLLVNNLSEQLAAAGAELQQKGIKNIVLPIWEGKGR